MAVKSKPISTDDVLAAGFEKDPAFAAEWLRLTPARAFAAMLIGYRADHGLSQRHLAERLGVSQPRVAVMESGERNPALDTAISVCGLLGTRFALSIDGGGSGAPRITAA